MYICICHAVTDTAIRTAVESGADSFSDLSFATGCGTQCGSCVPLARRVMNDVLATSGRSEQQTRLNVVATG